MNNYQKYEKEFKNILVSSMDFCPPLCDFISQHCNIDVDCETAGPHECDLCVKKFKEWLDKEYIVELTKFESTVLENLRPIYHYITKDAIDDCITVWENYPFYELAGYWVTTNNDSGEYAIIDCFPNFLSSLESDKVYKIDVLLNKEKL